MPWLAVSARSDRTRKRPPAGRGNGPRRVAIRRRAPVRPGRWPRLAPWPRCPAAPSTRLGRPSAPPDRPGACGRLPEPSASPRGPAPGWRGWPERSTGRSPAGTSLLRGQVPCVPPQVYPGLRGFRRGRLPTRPSRPRTTPPPVSVRGRRCRASGRLPASAAHQGHAAGSGGFEAVPTTGRPWVPGPSRSGTPLAPPGSGSGPRAPRRSRAEPRSITGYRPRRWRPPGGRHRAACPGHSAARSTHPAG